MLVQDSLLDAVLGAEAVLDHGSRAQVAQLGLHESPQIARRAVKNAEYGKQISVVLDDNAWTQLCGGNHLDSNPFDSIRFVCPRKRTLDQAFFQRDRFLL